MTKKSVLWAMAASLFLAVSCSDDDNSNPDPNPNPNPGEVIEQYVIAASEDDAVYLLQADELDNGELFTENAGIEEESATAWVFYNNKYAYRLVYAQGNPGIGSSYYLDDKGDLKRRNIRFEVTNRFTTYGTYGNYVIMAASGATADIDKTTGLPKYGITFTYIDAEAQSLKTKTVVTENITGNGEYYTIAGIVEKDGKFYAGLCPQGLSEYGVSQGYALDESLVVDGAVSPTQYPDSVWVAIYDGISFENPKIIKDNRISYATSRYRSQFYSTIAADASGNLYVLSASNAVGNSNAIQNTTKPSGVIRIKSGTEEFDQDYYVNIEELSGGRRMFKVWHITDDYFLLQMYADASAASAHNSDLRRLAIFKAGSKTFTWVDSGLPEKDVIESFGSFPCFENGLAYMPVVTNDGNKPAVYIIDPVTAKATKGLVVHSDAISAVGKLKNE